LSSFKSSYQKENEITDGGEDYCKQTGDWRKTNEGKRKKKIKKPKGEITLLSHSPPMSSPDPPSKAKILSTYYGLLSGLEELEKKKTLDLSEISRLENLYSFLRKPEGFLSHISLPKLPNPPAPIASKPDKDEEEKKEMSKSQKRKIKEKEKMMKKVEEELEKKKNKETGASSGKEEIQHPEENRAQTAKTGTTDSEDEMEEAVGTIEEVARRETERIRKEKLIEEERQIQYAGTIFIEEEMKKKRKLGKEGGMAESERSKLQHVDGGHRKNQTGNPEKID